MLNITPASIMENAIIALFLHILFSFLFVVMDVPGILINIHNEFSRKYLNSDFREFTLCHILQLFHSDRLSDHDRNIMINVQNSETSLLAKFKSKLQFCLMADFRYCYQHGDFF